MRRLLTLLLACAPLLLVAPGAFAHAGIADASPGPGDEVAPGGTTIALELTGIDPAGDHAIALLDADDEPLAIGAAEVAPDAAPADELGCAAADLPEAEAGEALGFDTAGIAPWIWWALGGAAVASAGLAGVAVVRSRRED